MGTMTDIKNPMVKDNIDPKPLNLCFLAIDLDTGSISIEESSSNKKIEPAPIGHYVHFCKKSEAIRLKRKFDRKPYLIEKFINQ